MKILKKGKQPWEGKKVECDECGCEFRLDASDRGKVKEHVDVDRPMVVDVVYSVRCPQCKSKVEF